MQWSRGRAGVLLVDLREERIESSGCPFDAVLRGIADDQQSPGNAGLSLDVYVERGDSAVRVAQPLSERSGELRFVADAVGWRRHDD